MSSYVILGRLSFVSGGPLVYAFSSLLQIFHTKAWRKALVEGPPQRSAPKVLVLNEHVR